MQARPAADPFLSRLHKAPSKLDASRIHSPRDLATEESGFSFSTARLAAVSLGHVPTKWNHFIDKDSLKFNELEHVRIEKVEQLFRDML
ncbi:MAG: hypothetical protein ACREDD_01590 [Methylocella sp.]